jgi:nitroreductase
VKVYEAAKKRRSIRRFSQKAVPWSILEKCVDAGRLAPSGVNRQPWSFIAINDPEILPGIFENIGGSVKLPPEKGGPRPDQTARAYIIMLINKDVEGDAKNRRISQYDLGMAAENIILVALEEGLGCCPVLNFNEANLKPLLEIPDNYDIGYVIVIGYPDEAPVAEDYTSGVVTAYVDAKGLRHVPKRKLADVIHKNKF